MSANPSTHNNPPEPVEDFKARIARYKTLSEKLGPVTEGNEQQYRDEIGLCGDLKREIEAQHKVEKAPHLEAGRKVDAAYKPLVDEAEAVQKKLKATLQAFVVEREREAKRIADEAARKLREAEEAAAKAAAVVEAEPEVEDLLAALAPAPDLKAAHAEAKTAEMQALAAGRVSSAAGGFRAMGLKTVRKGIVTNWDATLAHYASHLELQRLVLQLVNADIRHAKGADIQIPGVEIVTGRVL